MNTTDTQFAIWAPTAPFQHAALTALAVGAALLAFPWVNDIMVFMRIAALIAMSTR